MPRWELAGLSCCFLPMISKRSSPVVAGAECGVAAGPRCCKRSQSAGAWLLYYTQYLYFKLQHSSVGVYGIHRAGRRSHGKGLKKGTKTSLGPPAGDRVGRRCSGHVLLQKGGSMHLLSSCFTSSAFTVRNLGPGPNPTSSKRSFQGTEVGSFAAHA